ncbi:MAG: class II fructose-1,6-bisphosphate aldolase [Candidatus Peregrinibacteria bacterium]|nr:class II fructose-1,6-bisphosphate aldolase [Candidatus Peregrinibacteria bacterium]
MLVDTKEMFAKAYEGGYAIGAFNVNNMEIVQGIMEACNEKNAPVILQVSKGARDYASQIYLIKLIEAAIEQFPHIPVAMHLDHGPDFELAKECIDLGYTSVMIDCSHDEFEENIRKTKEVVDYAHSKGVTVEAELGQLLGQQFDDEEEGGGHSSKVVYTDPDQAVEFVKRTGCDSLAIAIGTSHGAYKFPLGSNPQLDLERLKVIGEKLAGYPIVLHGASSVIPEFVEMCNEYGGELPGAKGVPEEMISQAAKMAVCKVNIDSDIRLAMTGVIRKAFHDKPENFDPRKYLGPARDAVKEMVMHKLEVLGNVNRI